MMKYAILSFLLFFAHTAWADNWVYEGHNMRVRLTQSDCGLASAKETLALATDSTLKMALITYEGRDIEACWAYLVEQGKVLIMDADGDKGHLPVAEFHRNTGM